LVYYRLYRHLIPGFYRLGNKTAACRVFLGTAGALASGRNEARAAGEPLADADGKRDEEAWNMIKSKRALLAALAATPLLGVVPAKAGGYEGDYSQKVVYHINDSENAMAALRNVRNHLDADPKSKIVVVTHGKGIDFLLEGAEDKNKNPYQVTVQTLKERGVEFKVCNNTLVARKIDKSKVIPEADIVPSGVAEIGLLQAKYGFVYLKP
jgi:intracellular sulfur oxidation DsrE/DsrF family protein